MDFLTKEFVVAIAILGLPTISANGFFADEAIVSSEDAAEFHPGVEVIFRDSGYGKYANKGEPDQLGKGYPHYDSSSKYFGHWYRPKAFGLTECERCEPRPFRPRGLGNLGNKPSTCYRIDYHPFVLKDSRTRFGPSYYVREPDPRCPIGTRARGIED